ncbi:MAG: hypothetical protein ACYTFA_18435 [Planctomycetota bacterium]|jgi:hypothetical protein
MDNKEIVKRDNPAGRLWHILNAANSQRGGVTWKAWTKALGVADDDRPELLRQMSLLVGLVAHAEAAINLREDETALYHKPFENIYTCLFQNPEQRWDNTRQTLDGETMTALAFGAKCLSEKSPDPAVDKEELEQLLSEIAELATQVRLGALDDELKAVVVDQLEAIRAAIIQYHIRGSDGLREALKGSLGAIFLHNDLFQKHKETEEIRRFGRILGTLGRVSSAAFKALASAVAGRLLESLTEG